jgi:hypothetical protein
MKRRVRVVLPPGIIAQGITGQFGGMGGMGGMGGGMRSVSPAELPTASLKPGQTRHLPTRLLVALDLSGLQELDRTPVVNQKVDTDGRARLFLS